MQGRRHRPRQRVQTYVSNCGEIIVRGTVKQLVEKYENLALEASNLKDRVAKHMYLQHAEHYSKVMRGEV